MGWTSATGRPEMGETRCFFYCGCYSGDRGSQSFLRMPRKMGQSVRCIQFSKVLTPRLLLCISKGSSRLDCLETWTKMVCKWQFYSFPASSQRNCLPHKSSGVLPTPTPIPCHPRAPSTSICSTIYHTASYLLDPSPPPLTCLWPLWTTLYTSLDIVWILNAPQGPICGRCSVQPMTLLRDGRIFKIKS